MEVGFELFGDFRCMNECCVFACSDWDWDSENSCWVGMYSGCQKRLAMESGVLVVWDEERL